MVKIQVDYEGELRCRATHAPSGARIATDAPLDNQGRGESFSPTDLVAAALGTCMLTIMGIVARRHGWELSGASATVEKEMIADPARRIGRLTVVIRGPEDLDEPARRALEAAALTCPVHKSLHPSLEIPLRFEWSVARAGWSA
ncbi:MAG TPA: OsmC family protein [Planctomycetota bacterium]|nr:OsmC family protein [Planctomycetota bacterium]